MNTIPFWQVLLMHLAPVITALAAWRSSAKGAKTSKSNQEAILVVHGLVNGEKAALEAELAQARAELAALKDN